MSNVIKIDVNLIKSNPFQPRKTFDSTKMNELAHSIKNNGLLQPIIVRYSDIEGFYEVVAGERRLRSVKALGQKTIDCIIKNYDDRSTMRMTTIENLQRDDLNPIDEANAYRSLILEYGITQEKLSNIVSKSRSKITNSMRLLDLPEPVLKMVEEKEIKQSFARALLSIKDEKKIIEWANNKEIRKLSINNLERKISKEKKKTLISINKKVDNDDNYTPTPLIKSFESTLMKSIPSQKINVSMINKDTIAVTISMSEKDIVKYLRNNQDIIED